jgi:predicted pyridoxine 5'-phosphate oxidase superfamily flavin-nucleotide-binding protein
MLNEKISRLLHHRPFLTICTCDLNHIPNAAPKLILKYDNSHVYLVDYTFGRTWNNLKSNPQASLSLMDLDNLTGYQINGTVEIITDGEIYSKALDELEERKISLTVERIVQGVQRGAKHDSFEMQIPKNLVIFKIKIEEIAEMTPTGQIIRE